ncbi:MAG: iron ABC transporter permease [Pseudomonadota bacterium]
MSRRRTGQGLGPLGWSALGIALLFSIPILSVLSSLFTPSEGTWAHLASTVLPGYVLNTTILLFGVGIGAAVIGTGTAWLVTMCRFPGCRIFEWMLILPLAVPAYVMAYTYTDFLQVSGAFQSSLRALTGWQYGDYWFPSVRSLGGAVAMLILVLYPYVYMLARAAFLEQSACALEVSRTLGCSPWATFRRVALPLARPAIAAGTALVLMETLADYGTVSFFGVPTFTTGIVRSWFAFGDRVSAAQLSSILLAFVFAVLLFELWSRGPARYHHTSIRYQQLPHMDLSGWRAALAILACVFPIIFGFLLPGAILLDMAIDGGAGQFSNRYYSLVGNTVILASVTAVFAVALALIMAYGVRQHANRWTRLANRVASMGYAIPGTVIAVGVLIPFATFDNALDGWMRQTFDISTGLLLTGGIAALVFAYLVRFLAVSVNTVEASLGKIKPSMDEAARTLGKGPGATLMRVHAPLMWGSLLTALLMVFVDVMKELPATLVMRPFNFDTLAVEAHNFAADERLAQAALPSLTIVAVGIPPLIILSRAISQSRPGKSAPRT